ncbi:MAG: aminopeptidase P N-terminal domain-containing protein, partial [Blastocatellia bacterium]
MDRLILPNLTARGKYCNGPVAVLLVFAAFATVALGAPGNGELANQPKSEFAARRQRLADQVSDGIVVVIGAQEDEFGEVGRFRQKNSFMYLTGCETPSAYLILAPAGLVDGKAAQETLYIPSRNLFQERWTGPQIGPGPDAEQIFGIQKVESSDRFYADLFGMISAPPFKNEGGRFGRTAKIYTIFPEGTAGSLTRESQFVDLIRKTAPYVHVEDLSPIEGEMRKVKSPSEQKLLQKAVDITTEAQNEAR